MKLINWFRRVLIVIFRSPMGDDILIWRDPMAIYPIRRNTETGELSPNPEYVRDRDKRVRRAFRKGHTLTNMYKSLESEY